MIRKHPELRDSSTAWVVAAAVLSNRGILPWLFQNGVCPDSRLGNGGDTPLILAATYNDLEVMKILLEHGADINVKNAIGETALSRAREDKQLEATRLLERWSNQTGEENGTGVE